MLTLGQLKINFLGALNRIFAAVMARFAVSAANFVYAPRASQAEIILFVESGRKSPYLCNQKSREQAAPQQRASSLPSVCTVLASQLKVKN